MDNSPGEDISNGCLGVVQGLALVLAMTAVVGALTENVRESVTLYVSFLLLGGFLLARWTTMALSAWLAPDRAKRSAGCMSISAAIVMVMLIFPNVMLDPDGRGRLLLGAALPCVVGVLMGYVAVVRRRSPPPRSPDFIDDERS